MKLDHQMNNLPVSASYNLDCDVIASNNDVSTPLLYHWNIHVVNVPSWPLYINELPVIERFVFQVHLVSSALYSYVYFITVMLFQSIIIKNITKLSFASIPYILSRDIWLKPNSVKGDL